MRNVLHSGDASVFAVKPVCAQDGRETFEDRLPAAAAVSRGHDWFPTFTIENDMLGSGTDESSTSGLRETCSRKRPHQESLRNLNAMILKGRQSCANVRLFRELPGSEGSNPCCLHNQRSVNSCISKQESEKHMAMRQRVYRIGIEYSYGALNPGGEVIL